MRKLLLLLGLFAPVLASAQGIFISPRTVFGTVNGVTRPIPNATVTVCAAGAAGIPCSPALAGTLFKDAALTQPLANPTTTDANGNYPTMAVAGGTYTLTESAAGFQGFSYQVVVSCAPGICAITSLTVTGSATITGALTASKLNNIIYLDGITNTTLAGCYAAIPAGGGTCVVPPNYTETLSSSLTMNKNSAGFLFMGPSTITLGANQIIVPANNFGAFIKGTIPYGGIPGGSSGAVFNYSGSGIAILVGASPGATTRVFSMENIGINLTVANAATALYLKNVVYFDLKNILISGSSGVGSTGIVCDGTGNFCGNGTITNPIIQFIQTGILGTGSGGANSMNALTIIGGTIQSGSSSPMANSIGIDSELGFQDNVWGLDIEEEATAVKFGAGATFENFEIRSESCTQDMNAVAGSANNRLSIRAQGATFSLNTVDAGQGNIVGYTNSNASNTFQSGTLSGSISTTTLIQPVNAVKNFVVAATIYQNGIGIGCTGNTTIRAVVGASYNNGIGQNGYNVAGWSTASSTIADPAVLSVGNGTLANVIEYLPVTLSNLSGTTPVTIATTYTAGSGCSTPPTYYLVATVLPIK